MLSIIVDIVLALIVALGMVLGVKRGFIKTVAKPVKFVLTLVIAFSLASPISEKLIEPTVQAPIANQMEEYILEKCEGINSENINEELPTVLKIGAGIFNIDISKMVDGASPEAVINEIISSLISPAVHVVSTIISFIILYFVSGLALSLFLWLMNSFFDVGIAGVLNKILGFIFSTAFAVIIAWALCSLFTYIINLPAVASSEWVQGFEGGFVYKLFNSLNPIELLLSF